MLCLLSLEIFSRFKGVMRSSRLKKSTSMLGGGIRACEFTAALGKGKVALIVWNVHCPMNATAAPSLNRVRHSKTHLKLSLACTKALLRTTGRVHLSTGENKLCNTHHNHPPQPPFSSTNARPAETCEATAEAYDAAMPKIDSIPLSSTISCLFNAALRQVDHLFQPVLHRAFNSNL